MSLNDTERAVLALERQRWRYAGAKEAAIRERFELSATQYYQLLNTIIDDPEAYVAEPQLVKRLRVIRDARQQIRAARRAS